MPAREIATRALAYGQEARHAEFLGAKTLPYPTPVMVVGSYDAAGRANVMTAAWGGIACSKPPSVAVHELGLHTQFIGEIRDVKVDTATLGDDGRIDLDRLRPILSAPEEMTCRAVGAVVGRAFSMGKGLKEREVMPG